MPFLFNFEFLLKASQAVCLHKGQTNFVGVSTDSRQELKDRFFIALKGKKFDGHDFLDQAQKKGAKAFIVSHKRKAKNLLKNKKLTVIYVPDTLKALQSLARYHTQRMKIKVVAVTGSCGKSTTRSFAQTLFSSVRPFASPKSYNNSIGLPLSLLNVNRRKSFLIQELGTSSPGEIAFLTQLCRPIVSAVTMIGPSHLEGLGSVESVAREKKQIYLKSPKALWVFNRDNPWTEKFFHELSVHHPLILTFSSHYKKSDVCLRFLKQKADSSLIEGVVGGRRSKAKVLFSGQAHLENLMCACALALGAGIEPQKIWGLIPKCELPEGRGQWFHLKNKKTSIFFDAYNANPSSMDFFLQNCKKFVPADKCLFVIGDMRELGPDSVFYHQQLAQQIALLNPRFIAFIGKWASLVKNQLKQKKFKGQFISSRVYNEKILLALKGELKPGDIVAIKASRCLKLEELLFDLTGKRIF